MGTTLVLALIQDTQLCIAHVGDSRLYRVTRRYGLEQLTTDHEVGQRDIRRGIDPKIAYGRPDAYQLTQAIGPRPNTGVYPEIQSFTMTEDTLLLLCSDGMTDNDLLERSWESHLRPLLDFLNPLEAGLQQLVELANTENGHDNITVVGVRMKFQTKAT
ncbi:MAG: protein phosphatase 2C domain-containing protein, partial [Thermosynechococcaceae cyanobacterium]